jgi:hypothetical protein
MDSVGEHDTGFLYSVPTPASFESVAANRAPGSVVAPVKFPPTYPTNSQEGQAGGPSPPPYPSRPTTMAAAVIKSRNGDGSGPASLHFEELMMNVSESLSSSSPGRQAKAQKSLHSTPTPVDAARAVTERVSSPSIPCVGRESPRGPRGPEGTPRSVYPSEVESPPALPLSPGDAVQEDGLLWTETQVDVDGEGGGTQVDSLSAAMEREAEGRRDEQGRKEAVSRWTMPSLLINRHPCPPSK